MNTKTVSGKKAFVLTITAILCLSIPLQAANTDDTLLNILPEDCVFCLRINNFNQTLSKMDQYIAGISSTEVSLSALVSKQLEASIGDPMLTEIDLGGDFAVFAILPQVDESEPVLGMLIPVTNYKAFVEKNPNCTVGQDGMVTLSPPDSPMGNFIMMEAANGTYALVVPEFEKTVLPVLKEAITNHSKSLAQRASATQAKDAATAPVWVYGNLAGLYEKYNQEALDMIEMAQQEMGEAEIPQEMMAFQFKMLTQMFKQFAGDADSLTLTLTPESTLLNIDVAFQAKEGSELAKMLVADNNLASYALTAYLDNTNAVNGLMKINRPFMQAFYDKMFDIMEAATDTPESKEQTTKMKAITQKMLAAMGNQMAFSFSYAGTIPPFKMQEVVEVKDPVAMKALMTESMDYANTLYKAMAIPAELKYEPGTMSYKNTTIDTISISISASEDPDNMMQQELEKIYGENFKYYLAQSPDKFYITMGQDSEETIKKLIDQPAATATPSGDIKTAIDALKNTPYNDFVCSMNIIKLMKGMGEMMQAMGLQEGMEPVTALFDGLKDVQTQSCLVTGGKIADGQAAMRLAIPKQHLIEIVNAVMQMQQQAETVELQPEHAH